MSDLVTCPRCLKSGRLHLPAGLVNDCALCRGERKVVAELSAAYTLAYGDVDELDIPIDGIYDLRWKFGGI